MRMHSLISTPAQNDFFVKVPDVSDFSKQVLFPANLKELRNISKMLYLSDIFGKGNDRLDSISVWDFSIHMNGATVVASFGFQPII